MPGTPGTGLKAKDGKLAVPGGKSTAGSKSANSGKTLANGKSANTGKTAATPGSPGESKVAAYDPYKKFAVESQASANSDKRTNTNLYGDVLHWARQHRPQQ